MNRIKKKGFILWLLVVMLMWGIIGCTQQQNTELEEREQKASDMEKAKTLHFNLIGATIGGGGVWDLIATGIAETIKQKINGSTITSIPGEGVANVQSIHNNEAELGLTHSSIGAAAMKGIAPFDKKITDVKAIASLYPSSLQFISRKEFPWDSIETMINHKHPIKLAVGNPGSTGELATRRMLKAYGVTYDDIEAWGGKIYYKDMGEAADMLGDGLIDAFTLLTIAPAGPVQEVSSNHEVKMLPISEKVIKQMIDQYGYEALPIAQDAYVFLNQDISSFGSQVILITNDRMSEEDGYQITKALIENLDYLRTVHANLKKLTPEKMAKGTGVPLHSGAEKYYKEIGVLQ